MFSEYKKWGNMQKLSFIRVSFAILILAVTCCSASIDMYLYAQTPILDHYDLGVLKEKVDEHVMSSERRMVLLEDDSKQSSKRITILETTAESNTTLLRGIAVAIVLMALKELLVFNAELKRRNQKQRMGDV